MSLLAATDTTTITRDILDRARLVTHNLCVSNVELPEGFTLWHNKHGYESHCSIQAGDITFTSGYADSENTPVLIQIGEKAYTRKTGPFWNRRDETYVVPAQEPVRVGEQYSAKVEIVSLVEQLENIWDKYRSTHFDPAGKLQTVK